MQVEIEVRREGEAPRRVLVGPGVTHIGRAPDNDLVLPDVGVSRRHARLVVHEGRAVLEDLGSGNGTFLRGERLRRHTLADADEVVIDPFVLHVRVQAPPQVAAGRADEDETALVDQVVLDAVQPAPRQARLVVLAGPGLDPVYPLGAGVLTMGRSDERDVVVQDPASSRMQAEVRSQDGVYWLRDFGSANGTFVNGRRVRERPLQHGDRIRIGATELRFELQDVDAAAPAAGSAVGSAVGAAVGSAVGSAPAISPPPAATPRAAPRNDTVPVPAAPAAARGGKGSAGLVIGAVAGVVVLGMMVVVVAAGLVGWRAWSARQATLAAAELVAAEQPAAAQSAAAQPAAAQPAAAQPAAAQPAAAQPAAAQPAGQGEQAQAAAPPPRTTQATAQPAAATAVQAAAQAEAQAEVTAADGVQALMSRGEQLFLEGRFLEATALYYKALKRDPSNAEAERMCYVSCEFLALDQLRTDIEGRLVPEEERQRLYAVAIDLGRKAARGRGDLDEAEQAIVAALEWYPTDAELAELQRSIQGRRARGTPAATGGARKAATASAGATSGDKRLAREYLDEGLQAIEDGRFVVARDRLGRALGLDPSLSGARSNLADVERVLEDRARNAWAQGQALESQGDRDGALAAYQQVVTYASRSQSSLKSQAQARIDALGG